MGILCDVTCFKTNEKLNITRGEIYTAYRHEPQNIYEIIVGINNKIYIDQKRFDEYFMIKRNFIDINEL